MIEDQKKYQYRKFKTWCRANEHKLVEIQKAKVSGAPTHLFHFELYLLPKLQNSGQQPVFCKGTGNKCLKLCRPDGLVSTIHFCCYTRKAASNISKWVWLSSNQALWILKSEFHIMSAFAYYQILFLFCNIILIFQLLKNIKTILNLIPKLIVGQAIKLSHVFPLPCPAFLYM